MFFIKIPFCDLDKIYECEQSSNWYKIRNGKYCIVDGEHYITVEQGYKNNFGFNCSEDEFYEYWYQYFSVDVDYLGYMYKIRSLGQSFKRVTVRGKGIRIIRQQLTTVIIQEVFRQNLGTERLSKYIGLFAKGIGIRHKNSIRGGGVYTWYEIPNDTKIILGKYSKIVNVFKSNIIHNKKQIISSLKTIKVILSDIDWYDFDNITFGEFVDTFMIYDLSYEACQRIWMYGLHNTNEFVIDEEIERAVENVDDWDEYDNANDFVEWSLIDDDLVECSGLLNQLMRWDLRHPPRPGDEVE